MVGLVARNQVVRAIRDLRFVTFGGLIMILSGIGGILHGTSYRNDARAFEAQRAEFWKKKSIKSVMIGMPPSPLSFVAEAHGTHLPNFLRVEPDYVDDRGGLLNPTTFLLHSQHLDWIFIFAAVGSLVAIAFTYDACNGERERGTLRLCLSSAVRRSSFLTGKYIGIMTVVGIPVAGGALLNFAFYSALVPSCVTPNLLIRVGLCFGLILSFLSFWVAFGLLMSCICRRPVTSALSLFFAWVVFLMLIPQASGIVASLARHVPSKAELEPRARLIRQRAVTGLTAECWERMREIVDSDLARDEKIARLGELSASITKDQEANLRECRRQLKRLMEERNRARAAQTELARSLACLSPMGLLSTAVEDVANTGYSRYARFREQAESFMREYTDYVDFLENKYRDKAVYMDRASGVYKGYKLNIEARLSYDSVEFDYGGFPTFIFHTPPLDELCADAAGAAITLLILNLVVLSSGFAAFRTFDVR